MITIAEPGRNISKLWGKQAPKPAEKYRLMRYVLRVEHGGKTALHNNVTGQLVLLSETETEKIDALPVSYDSGLDSLIADHFLVPLDYDEHKQVVNLRSVLKKLAPVSQAVTHYTILPTTACNARCYYCFEQGVRAVTMTEKTAEDTVRFIADHCGEQKHVFIIWFGGEPTVAAGRIDQICEGLQAEGISYRSMMYTNGYLMDEKMCERARELWHLNHVQMSVDGTEQIYNEIKAYVNAEDNPYQTVLRNIGCMLEAGISVAVRMNVDYINYQNFSDLMQDFIDRYEGSELLNLCAYALIGEYADHDGVVRHADESWIAEKVEELNRLAKEKGLIRPAKALPQIVLNACMSDNASTITIGADGNLIRCAEHFQNEDAVGTLMDGITEHGLVREWQTTIEPAECSECTFFPNCLQLAKCSAAGHCYRQGKKQQHVWNIQKVIEDYFGEGEKENEV